MLVVANYSGGCIRVCCALALAKYNEQSYQHYSTGPTNFPPLAFQLP